MKTKSRKWVWIGGAVAVVIVVVLAAPLVLGQLTGGQPADVAGNEVASAFIGDLSASATASGQVLAQREANLALNAGGTVAQVFVEVGDRVQAGDPLLALETGELERAVASAQQALIYQETNLATLQAPPSAADVAASQAALASARANLQDLLDGPSPDEIASAEASVRSAEADLSTAVARLNALRAAAGPEELQAAELQLALAQQQATSAAEQHSTILVTEPNRWLSESRLAEIELSARAAAVQANANLAAAQEALDALLHGDANTIAAGQAGVTLAAARRDAAQAALDMQLEGASQAQIASAEASVAQAEASLDRLQRGPSDSQVALAEIGVAQAQLSVQRAELNLAEATLRAPFDGVVTAVNVAAGEQAGGVLIEMVDTDSLEVVLEVDEVDIGRVTVGQPAVVTLESLPGAQIEGQVAAIAPKSSSDNSAVVSFQVSIGLGETDRPVRVGMTADASLVTSRRTGVLLVPSAAINADRQAGTYSVNRVSTDAAGQQTIEVLVTIGLRDEVHTEITGGLQAGDQVVVGVISGSNPLSGMRGPFGGQ